MECQKLLEQKKIKYLVWLKCDCICMRISAHMQDFGGFSLLSASGQYGRQMRVHCHSREISQNCCYLPHALIVMSQ